MVYPVKDTRKTGTERGPLPVHGSDDTISLNTVETCPSSKDLMKIIDNSSAGTSARYLEIIGGNLSEVRLNLWLFLEFLKTNLGANVTS